MRRLIVLPLLALAVSACAATATPSATPSPSASSSASASASASPSDAPTASPSAVARLVFRVAPVGGFLAPGADLALLPQISVYDDGTIVVPGTSDMADPGPAVPDLETYKVGAAGLAAFLTAARATGLGDPAASFDGFPMPDAGATSIAVDVAGTLHHVTIVSLGAAQDRGLAPKVVAARVKLRALLDSLTDLRTRFGADLLLGPAPYRATAMRLIVGSGAPGAGGGTSVTWPLAAGLASFGQEMATGGSRCGVVSGADLATLAPALAGATTLTTWTSEGQPWTITARPLLPDESGCL